MIKIKIENFTIFIFIFVFVILFIFSWKFDNASKKMHQINIENKIFDNGKEYNTDIVVVGAGLTGAVLANKFASLGKKVLVIEKRNHIAGNCYDYIDEKTKILVNKYGAHIFHTNDEEVWNYIQTFDEWKRWDHEVIAKINDTYIPIPVNINTVNMFFKINIQTLSEMIQFLNSIQKQFNNILDSEQMALSRVGTSLYKAIFEPYTFKQWGKHPSMLDAEVTARIPVRTNFDNRYFTDKYQALPRHGYTYLISKMLSCENIEIVLNTDFLQIQNKIKYNHLFFTGPIDQYFENHGLPKLEYRSLNFDVKYYMNIGNGYVLPKSVVNYPGLEYPFTRIVEYKHFLHQKSEHSILFYEYSTDVGEPYYPVPNARNKNLYKQYVKISTQNNSNVSFVGRLANYKYFNMDEAIKNALAVFKKYVDGTQKSIFIKNDELLGKYNCALHSVECVNNFLSFFVNNLRKLLEVQNCMAYHNQTVLVSMTDMSYESGFLNFKNQYVFHKIQCVVVISFDELTFRNLIKFKIPTIFFSNNNLRLSYHIGITKAIISYSIIKLGFNILFSEMDVFWADSPLKYINWNFDHHYSEHSYDPEINLGLYFSQSTNCTVDVYKRICFWMFQHQDYDTRIGAADQKIFDYALRGNSRLIPENFLNEPQSWTRWPHSKFWHNEGENWKSETKTSRITYHLSFGIGEAHLRISAAKQIGVWYENF